MSVTLSGGGALGAGEIDVDAVVEGVLAEMGARPDWVASACLAAGVPMLDVASTAMSTRAAALGLRTGRGFVHHELRVRAAMPAGLEPEVAVWDGGTVPEWSDGVLAEPKYFSFFQDAPLPVFNPNYRGKWRPHELLHGAVGFFWHPEMTRFEFYVGARVAEILPVVHWYGFDEMFRPRCDAHRHGGATARHCVACESSRRAFWELQPTAEDVSVASGFLRQGVEHLADELGACRREMQSARVVARPRPGLDSASDAQGYLRSHWNRCTAWSFGSWVELFLEAGEDYVGSVGELTSKVEAVAAALLEPATPVDPGRFERLYARRELQDLGYRVLLELERLGEEHPAQDVLWPLLEDAGAACREALAGDAPVESRWADLARGARAFGLLEVDAQGRLGRARTSAEFAQVVHGLGTVFQNPPDAAAVERFAASPGFWAVGRLASRFVRQASAPSAAGAGDGLPGLVPSALESSAAAQRRLEAWVADEPRSDPEAECFAAVPDGAQAVQTGRVRVSETLRTGWFPASVLGEEGGESVELACVIWDGEAKVIALSEGQRLVLGWLRGQGGEDDPVVGLGRPQECGCPDEAALVELVHVGAVAWFPPVGV